MMKVATRKGKSYIKVDGELTVSRAADFKDAVTRSFEKTDTVEINLDEVSRIDLAGLQVLCSAHRTADTKGKTLAVKEPAPAAYVEACRNAGFMYSKPCRFVTAEDCLWVGGDEK